ncbi:MAG: DUF1361 domain-containing protein [Flavobacteriales bacterium]|jgi:uncharacterized membrane protein|nr:DUF1361 domain-containing protein [Flavobacteriales bacterium]
MKNLQANLSDYKVHVLLALMTGFCLLLSILRVYLSGSFYFLFLVWNLFLAAVPYSITLLISSQSKSRVQLFKIIGVSIIWLLFFPNAPYILTDLFHLRLITDFPKWFDLILIISYAWTGLLLGFLSLLKIEDLYRSYLSNKQIGIFSSLILFVASFGIYLGRYLRWNSWDVLNNPQGLLYDISNRFIHPFDHPRTWGMTLLFGVLLNMIYWTIKLLRKDKQSSSVAREEYFII